MSNAPLEGLKILDFSSLLPGPYATMMLADLGAEVLQIVSKSRPDVTGQMPPFISDTDITAASAWLGRNKRSMYLNLKQPEAKEIIHLLIENYDIVIEQFRPGVMDRLGLNYTHLSDVNPTIIYCSLTGYGQNGPHSHKAGHDINFLARSGTMSYSGRRNSGPSLTSMQIADVAIGSNHLIIGVLAAVIHRNRTGEGQHIDISMLDGMLALNALYSANYLVDGKEPSRENELLNGGSLYDYYETRDGQYISFGGVEPKFFTQFFREIGCSDLIETGIRPENIVQVKKRIQDIIKSKSREEWESVFEKIDACVEPVLTLSEALEDTHVKERELIVKVPVNGGGIVRQLGTPIKFSKSNLNYNSAGTKPGTHTYEVLNELGYDGKIIKNLQKKGVFD